MPTIAKFSDSQASAGTGAHEGPWVLDKPGVPTSSCLLQLLIGVGGVKD